VARNIIDAKIIYMIKSLRGTQSFEKRRIRANNSKKEFKKRRMGEIDINLNLRVFFRKETGLNEKSGINISFFYFSSINVLVEGL